jgi:hypothetical protein
MGEMNYNSPQLAEAVRIWTGWGTSLLPNRNDARVVQHYGEEKAAQLLPMIKLLEDDFYTSDARFTAEDLAEMAVVASQHFAQKHPGIDEDIVEALTWCYTFDFK